jgi:hypothetical protein
VRARQQLVVDFNVRRWRRPASSYGGAGLARGVENIPEDLPGALREERERSAGAGAGTEKYLFALAGWQPELAGAESVRCVRHRRRRCRRPRRHTGSACWGPTELLGFS